MKKILLFFMCCAIIGLINAQLPFMNYQGVARNTAGQPMANQPIYIKSTILSDYPVANTTHYVEVRLVTTNQFGLFSFQLGNPTGATVIPLGATGVPPGAEYFFIQWEKLANTRLNTAISTNGGSSFTDLGTSTLVNVPFANVANYAKAAAPWTTSTNFNTITPDLAGWKLGLGTNNATERLHVVGNVRVEDGNVGIGTTTATQKLHVVGKIRMVDGNQFNGYLLESDASGVATWTEPVWKKIQFGSRNEISVFDPAKNVGIGLEALNPATAKLHVNGSLRFATGDQAANRVLTSDAVGNATWKDPSENINNLWIKNGQYYGTNPQFSSNYYNSLSPVVITPTDPLSDYWQGTSSYPLFVDGKKHGMAISLNNPGVGNGTNSENKFITFFDKGFTVRGRIEGQTADEIVNSREFILFNFFRATVLGEYIAEGIGCLAQLDFVEIGINEAAAIALGVEWAIQVGNWRGSAGIAYVSGSADYAEWLEKADPFEKFTYGDIVEVIGGKISKTITGKGQLMVISMAPIVLGNMPEKGKEKLFEKVAFMGQVPVKTTGDVAIGDYIISSGNNDGIGYAVHLNDITPEEYKRMAGVAWSKSSGKAISLINTAVGLKTNAVVDMVKKQEEKTNTLTAQLNQLGAYLMAKDPTFKFKALSTTPPTFANETIVPVSKAAVTTAKPATQGNTSFNPKEYAAKLNATKVKKLLEEHPEAVTEAWKYFKETMLENAKAQHADLNTNPKLKLMVNDRQAFVDNIKQAFGIM